jgi:hypothetical protein
VVVPNLRAVANQICQKRCLQSCLCTVGEA